LNKQAVQEHKDTFSSDPGAFYANAYSAMLAMTNAVAKAGSTDLAALKKALQSEKVDTPVGTISFDERGDAIGVGFSVYQVKDGTFVELK
jgi:branched-chain amino acid transport system substrate-binding protein